MSADYPKSDWVYDHEDELLEGFVRDGGKNVDCAVICALVEHYDRLQPKPKNLARLVDDLINRDKGLNELYLQYVDREWEQKLDEGDAKADQMLDEQKDGLL